MPETVIKKNATTKDTVKLIIDVINTEANGDFVISRAQKILLQSDTNEQVLRNLFNYVCSKVTYKLDPKGFERVTTPARLEKDGFGDCKKITVFIASVLKCLNIDCILKVISYDGNSYEHIYVIVPVRGSNYITLDPVNDKLYNAEIDHVKELEFHLDRGNEMELQLLSGKPGNFVRFSDLDYRDNYNMPSRFLNELNGSFEFNSNPVAESRFLNQLAWKPGDAGYAYPFNSNPVAESRFLNQLGASLKDVDGSFSLGDTFWGEALDTLKHISNGGVDILIDNIRNKGLTEGVSTLLQAAGAEFDKATLVFRTINGAGTRVAFCVAVAVNFSNIAGDLYGAVKQDKSKVVYWWEQQMGGQWSDLQDAINKGLKYAGRTERLSGIGEAVSASTAAAIVAACGVIASALTLLKQMHVVTPQQAASYNGAMVGALQGYQAGAQGLTTVPTAQSVLYYAPYALGLFVLYKIAT